MKKILTFTTGTLLATSMLFSPMLALAKENEKNTKSQNQIKIQTVKAEKNEKEDKGDRDDRKENATTTKNKKNIGTCLKAFGHLIAPGWIKNNSQLSLGENCNLPFGIAKKFRGTATSTPPTVDTTAPIISSLKANSRVLGAVLRWTTNEKSDSTVFYSLTSPVNVNASSTLSVSNGTLVRDHQVVIGSLQASTTYYAIVRSRDASGNTTLSSQISFTTKSPLVVNDTTPPVISAIVSFTATTSVRVGWTTNEFSTSRVYYSTLASVDINATTTAFVENISSLTKNHLMTVSPLSSGTVYHFKVESTDASLNVSRSPAFSATTTSGI